MPVIRQPDFAIPDIRPTETGIDATVQVARRAGAFFNQAAEARRTVGDLQGRMFSSAVEAAGNVAVDYAQHQEISHGAAAYAGLNDALTQQWNDKVKNADPNDPNVASQFREQVLEPQLEKFGQSFLTEGGQKWAEARVDALRNHMFEKTAADMSSLAREALNVNVERTRNGLSNTAMTDSTAVPHLLDSADAIVGGIVDSSPNIKGTAAQGAKLELTQKIKEQIVKAGAIGAIQRAADPEAEAAKWGAKYPEYINGAELKMLSANARQQKSAAFADYERARRIDREARQDQSDATQTDVLRKLYSGDPKQQADVSVKNIINLPDSQLNLAGKKQLRTIIERELKPETDAKISARTSADIFRMSRDPNVDPQKVRDAIFEARSKDPGEPGSMTQADFKAAIQNLDDIKTPEGQERSHERDTFLKRFAATIDPSMGDTRSDQFGHHTALGLQKMYETEKALQAKEKELGPNWRTLYDPNSPNFFGKPVNIMKYRATMQEAADYQATLSGKNLTGNNSTITGVDIVNIPAGMSPDEVMKKYKSGQRIRLPDGRTGTVP